MLVLKVTALCHSSLFLITFAVRVQSKAIWFRCTRSFYCSLRKFPCHCHLILLVEYFHLLNFVITHLKSCLTQSLIQSIWVSESDSLVKGKKVNYFGDLTLRVPLAHMCFIVSIISFLKYIPCTQHAMFFVYVELDRALHKRALEPQTLGLILRYFVFGFLGVDLEDMFGSCVLLLPHCNQVVPRRRGLELPNVNIVAIRSLTDIQVIVVVFHEEVLALVPIGCA